MMEAYRFKSGLPQELSFLGTMEGRTVCRMRLILALSALLIIWIDPSEPDRLVPVTYGALVLYSCYSAALYLLAVYRPESNPLRASHWIDVGWYALLVALSSGTSSIFFFFFLFAILVASFQWGFTEGLRVTLVSALLFTVIGLVTAPAGHAFELNRFLLRPIYMGVLGYMMARWGGFELQLKRRLTLLQEVNALSNPRFGIGQTVSALLKRVRVFYDADAGLLILSNSARTVFRLTRVERGETAHAAQSELIPEELAQQFLALPEDTVVVCNLGPRSWLAHDEDFYAFSLTQGKAVSAGRAESERLAVALDAESFISVPLWYRGQALGRVYFTGRRGLFGKSEADFLLQIAAHVTPVLDNIRLLDRLASDAAEQERQKIARDIHDSVIQPYIGLQYKVAAIRNKLLAGSPDVTADLEHLFAVTMEEITGLRRYVRALKDGGAMSDDLVSAVRRYSRQFEESYGIAVRVEPKTEVKVNDRLAAELIQITHEGLSNVRKHTEATSCAISFERCDERLVLCIENDNASAPPAAAFVPRSITERAENLGGQARVEHRAGGRTIVRVEIPL